MKKISKGLILLFLICLFICCAIACANPNMIEPSGAQSGNESGSQSELELGSESEIESEVARYHISFDVNGGNGVFAPIDLELNGIVTLPIACPSLEDCDFLGWYYENTKIESGKIWDIPNDAVFMARWLPDFTLSSTGVITSSPVSIKACKEIVIPTIIGNTCVTGIANGAFNGFDKLKSIIIPSTIDRVDDNTFNECVVLENFEVSGDNAKYKSIEGSLYSKDGETLIQYALGKTNTSFSIPEGVQWVKDKALNNCNSLKSIYIPSTVERINLSTCKTVENIEVSNVNAVYKSIDGNLYSKDCKKLIEYAKGKTNTSFVIPNSVREIESGAFDFSNSLESVVIPYGVSKISFSYCSALKNVNIPNGVNYINFDNCTSLEYLDIPSSVTDIGSFENCTSLKSIDIPGKRVIYPYTFWGCTSLESVTLSDGTEIIAERAFYDCKSLKNITFPSSLWRIDEGVFENCTSLENIILEDVRVIGMYAFRGCIALKNIALSDKLEAIYDDAFSNCVSLKRITIPSSVRAMSYPFWGCVALESIEVSPDNDYYKSIDGNLYSKDGKDLIQYVPGKKATTFVIPHGVENIRFYAFKDCIALINLTLPNSLKNIGSYAFSDCVSLDNISFDGTVEELLLIENARFFNINVPAIRITCTNGGVGLIKSSTY